MKNRTTCLSAFLVGTAIVSAAPASAQSRQTFLDISGGLGYSTNPLLRLGNDTESAFARISARGVHAWESERAATRLSAFVENATYTRGELDSTQIFDLSAHTEYQTSETVRLFGDLGFSGDFGGQLSTRFLDAPTFPQPAPGTITPPPSLTPTDPQLFGLTGRQYRLYGQVGASIRPTEREQWSLAANLGRYFYSGSRNDLDYWVYGATAGYERQVTERSSLGARLTAQRSDFGNGDRITTLSPQITYRTRFSEVWDAQLAVGVSYSDQNTALVNDSNFDLALDGSLCRTLENDRLCVRASRNTQNTATTDLLETTTAGVDWSRRLGERDTIQLNAAVSRYTGQLILGEERPSTYFVAGGSYSRQFSDRLSAGVNATARKLTQFGTDPKADVGGSVFVTYRLGDIR